MIVTVHIEIQKQTRLSKDITLLTFAPVMASDVHDGFSTSQIYIRYVMYDNPLQNDQLSKENLYLVPYLKYIYPW